MMQYQHHSGVISASLWDKYQKETLRLESPYPGVAPSSAAIIERDFFRDQMLTSNKLANLRLDEVKAKNRTIETIQGTMQKQHAALAQKEGELRDATAMIAKLEKDLSNRDQELGKLKEVVEKQKEELPRKGVARFLGSRAFTVAAQISCENVIRAAIYEELKGLSELYPFDPERCGFVEIPEDDQHAKTLAGWTWDDKKDRLLTPEKKRAKLPENYMAVEARDIPIPWKGLFQWPVDVNDISAGWIPGGSCAEEGRVEEEAPEDLGLGQVRGDGDEPSGVADPAIGKESSLPEEGTTVERAGSGGTADVDTTHAAEEAAVASPNAHID